MNFFNGVLPTEKITNDFLTAEEKGLTALNSFIEDQLVKQAAGFYELVKKLKLSTFSTQKKTTNREKYFWKNIYH